MISYDTDKVKAINHCIAMRDRELEPPFMKPNSAFCDMT